MLPPRFVKIRHYGLNSPAHARTTLEQARLLLAATSTTTAAASVATPRTAQAWLLKLTGVDLTRCPRCGYGPLVRRPLPPATLVPAPAPWNTS